MTGGSLKTPPLLETILIEFSTRRDFVNPNTVGIMFQIFVFWKKRNFLLGFRETIRIICCVLL